MIKKYEKISNQKGRSMLELMAVLLILSIMTMMGVKAFPMLMNKYERQKLLEQVVSLANDIRAFHSNIGHYKGLNNESAIAYSLVSPAMLNGDNYTIEHAKRGNLIISVPSGLPSPIVESTIFEIKITKLNRENCMSLALQDLKSTLSDVYRIGIGSASGAFTYYNVSDLDKNITIDEISQKCDCDPKDDNISHTCAIVMSFY
ncbi:MAG: type II secretion system protein [Alphaproteobacteria bacterium]